MVNNKNNNNNNNKNNNNKVIQNPKNPKSAKNKQTSKKNVNFNNKNKIFTFNNQLHSQELQPSEPITEQRLQEIHQQHHQHNKHSHRKHQHDHFKEDLHKAIAHFESSKEDYAKTLQYPEIFMARIPFLCPVPTAIARLTNIFAFTTNPSDTFYVSYIPEALTGTTTSNHFPLYFEGSAGPVNPTNLHNLEDGLEDLGIVLSNSMTREAMYPSFSFDSVAQMRVVGSSMTMTQTNRLVDRAGYGLVSRVYGMDQAMANTVNSTAIINSVYKDEANFTNGETLRMVYAPGDFSDLHMKNQNHQILQDDLGTLPVIQAFCTGYNNTPVTFTIEFNTVVEYVPKPIIQQMVERKPARISPSGIAKAENAVGRLNDFKLSDASVYSEFADASPQTQFNWADSVGKQQQSGVLNFIRGQSKGMIPSLPDIGSILSSSLTSTFSPFKSENNAFLATPLPFKESNKYTEKHIDSKDHLQSRNHEKQQDQPGVFIRR